MQPLHQLLIALLMIKGYFCDDTLDNLCSRYDLSEAHFEKYRQFVHVETGPSRQCVFGENRDALYLFSSSDKEILIQRADGKPFKIRVQRAGLVDESPRKGDNGEIVYVDTRLSSPNFLIFGGCRNGEMINHFFFYNKNITEEDLQAIRSKYPQLDLSYEEAQQCAAGM